MVLEAADVKKGIIIFLDPDLKISMSAANFLESEEIITLLFDGKPSKRIQRKNIKGGVFYGSISVEEARNTIQLANKNPAPFVSLNLETGLMIGNLDLSNISAKLSECKKFVCFIFNKEQHGK